MISTHKFVVGGVVKVGNTTQPTETPEVGTLTILIIEIGKLRLGEVRYFAQGHVARKQ